MQELLARATGELQQQQLQRQNSQEQLGTRVAHFEETQRELRELKSQLNTASTERDAAQRSLQLAKVASNERAEAQQLEAARSTSKDLQSTIAELEQTIVRKDEASKREIGYLLGESSGRAQVASERNVLDQKLKELQFKHDSLKSERDQLAEELEATKMRSAHSKDAEHYALSPPGSPIPADAMAADEPQSLQRSFDADWIAEVARKTMESQLEKAQKAAALAEQRADRFEKLQKKQRELLQKKIDRLTSDRSHSAGLGCASGHGSNGQGGIGAQSTTAPTATTQTVTTQTVTAQAVPVQAVTVQTAAVQAVQTSSDAAVQLDFISSVVNNVQTVGDPIVKIQRFVASQHEA